METSNHLNWTTTKSQTRRKIKKNNKMKLTKFLSEQGYDLIEGPIRNHKPLQLWLKQTLKYMNNFQ